MEKKFERRLSKDLNIDLKDELKNFKDVKSIDDLDFDKIDLQRGKTPEDIKEKCLKLCQEYLSGNWCQQNLDTIEVRRVSGGLTNQLYYCGINNKCEKESVPQEVAIRLYGPKYFDSCDNESNERLSDIIIGLMVSENKFGPKIYGIFEEGQIQKFYKHRQFKEDEQKNLNLVREVFQRLAKIHAMAVPIKKNTNWLFKWMKKSLEEAYNKFPIEEEINEYNCETLKNYSFEKELEWINDVFKRVKSPVVFTHNDFRSSNLMITEPNNELVVCDFEYSGYGYRGHDFNGLMREWGRNPMDFKSIEGLPPDDSVFRPLIEIYIEECVKIFGKSYSENEINSVENILKETKIFVMNSYIYFSLFFLKNDESTGDFPLNRQISMQFSDICFKNYFILKTKLIDQKIIQLN